LLTDDDKKKIADYAEKGAKPGTIRDLLDFQDAVNARSYDYKQKITTEIRTHPRWQRFLKFKTHKLSEVQAVYATFAKTDLDSFIRPLEERRKERRKFTVGKRASRVSVYQTSLFEHYKGAVLRDLVAKYPKDKELQKLANHYGVEVEDWFKHHYGHS
jgi:hypothetical protein